MHNVKIKKHAKTANKQKEPLILSDTPSKEEFAFINQNSSTQEPAQGINLC